MKIFFLSLTCLCCGTIGGVMSYLGYDMNTWEYWVILLAAVFNGIFAHEFFRR